MHYPEGKIRKAMVGNMVWCRNGIYAIGATPCDQVNCPFKHNETRLAEAKELSTCGTFQITYPASEWRVARHVYPTGDEEYPSLYLTMEEWETISQWGKLTRSEWKDQEDDTLLRRIDEYIQKLEEMK